MGKDGFSGGKLLGIIGALIALPLAAVLRMLFEEFRVDMARTSTCGCDGRDAAGVPGQIADKTQQAERSAREDT